MKCSKNRVDFHMVMAMVCSDEDCCLRPFVDDFILQWL